MPIQIRRLLSLKLFITTVTLEMAIAPAAMAGWRSLISPGIQETVGSNSTEAVSVPKLTLADNTPGSYFFNVLSTVAEHLAHVMHTTGNSFYPLHFH